MTGSEFKSTNLYLNWIHLFSYTAMFTRTDIVFHVLQVNTPPQDFLKVNTTFLIINNIFADVHKLWQCCSLFLFFFHIHDVMSLSQ